MERDPPASASRLRRLRRTPALRDAVAETRLSPADLIYPIFVRPDDGPPQPIPSLPGIERYGPTDAAHVAEAAARDGVAAVLLFGLPRRKDDEGSDAWSEESAVARTIRAIKATTPEIPVVTDVCLCAYTTHGHCGLLAGGEVDNDATLDRLARVAVAHARSGADVVAPSAMMDHQVRAIRAALDAAGFSTTAILGYSAKFASAFNGPFREAAESAPTEGDRRGYQLDVRNAREALREIAADVAEGADLVMVKPALPYLDILVRARRRFDVPLVAYQVSGEYALLKAAAEKGWIDERSAATEALTAIRRAGADLIITYYARAIAAWKVDHR